MTRLWANCFCLTGKSPNPVQPRLQKYFRSRLTQIRCTCPAIPSRKRGVSRSSRTLGTGCGGRGSVGHVRESQGEMNLVSDKTARGRQMLACVRQSRVGLAPVAGVKLAEARRLDRA